MPPNPQKQIPMFQWELTRHDSPTVGREPREKEKRKGINKKKKKPQLSGNKLHGSIESILQKNASGPTLKKIGKKMTHARSLVRDGGWRRGGGVVVYRAMIATESHEEDDFTAIH